MKKDFYNDKDYIEKQRLSHLGDKNINWKGGNSRWYHWNHFWKDLGKSLEQKCSLCNSKKLLLVHHIDFNYKNNILKNIQIVCRSCHLKIHKIHINNKRDKYGRFKK